MDALTTMQQKILDFLRQESFDGHPSPTQREISTVFNFKSHRAAACHLEALRKKGFIEWQKGKARSVRLLEGENPAFMSDIFKIPLYGAISAGFPDERRQEAKGYISFDLQTLGIKPSRSAFVLEVRGDSMIGKLIAPGDLVLIEPQADPKSGDVVVALIDGESTLKTFIQRGAKSYLQAENPRYPDLTPVNELVIQGVMVALIRKRK